MRKATAIAPSNIAFTKYWGKKDEALRIPENGSISMCLSGLLTTTTVEFSPNYKKDEVTITPSVIASDNEAISNKDRHVEQSSPRDDKRVIEHLNRIRKLAKISLRAKVVSHNNFPLGTGLSSSASGFAALTVAAVAAAGLKLSEKELSILARQGSGSACRSIPSGFVEWLDGTTSETSYAKQIFPEDYWKIADVVAVVGKDKKEVATTVGQQSARSSPFMRIRLSRMKAKNNLLKKLIRNRKFAEFGELIEAEAFELHAIILTQTPPLVYWLPGTIKIMRLTRAWRSQGLPVYFTINTGHDVHLICEQKNAKKVAQKLRELGAVKSVIINTPALGARLTIHHLF